MPRLAYLFERFPSFTQTFCYREISALDRAGITPAIFSIRTPAGEPPQPWDQRLVERVHYLPEEKALVEEIGRARGQGKLPAIAVEEIDRWGRANDFLRLYQAAYIGLRLREIGVERVHAHFAGMAARTAFWIRRFFGIPFSFTAHANDFFAPKPFTVGLSELLSAAEAVVAVSDFGAQVLRERFPVQAGKVRRIYNGISLEQFTPSAFDLRPPTIVSVGRLIAKKGFADLIEACRLLKVRGLEFRCRIVGDGPLESALRAQIGSGSLVDCVELMGAQTQAEIAAMLTHANLFVLACATEPDGGMDNLPTVIAEAMAAGLPVVSTRLAGVPEMVSDGETGLLVAERDPVALAGAMERLLADAALARVFGARGREVARARFSVENRARELAGLFGA